MENNKNLEENTKINADILKENFLTLNSNIGKIEHEVKEEVKTTSDKIFNKYERIEDEMIRSFESLENQVKSLNHTNEKKYENITKENPEIFNNENLSLSEDLSILNLNIGKVEQEVNKTKEKVATSSNDMYNKVKPIKDEVKSSLESFDDQAKSLNHTNGENSSKVTSIDLKKNNTFEKISNIEMLVKGMDDGMYSISQNLLFYIYIQVLSSIMLSLIY